MRRVIIILACLLWAWGGYGATYTVVNTNDGGPGSFRDALNFANTTTGRDTILFSIPGIGPFILFPQSPYPLITDPSGVFIDGFSQAGAFAGASPPYTASLQVVLDGAVVAPLMPCNGLEIMSSGNTIQGLVIMNFPYDGIRITANMPPTMANLIYCNFIGTNPTGTLARPNGTSGPNAYAGVYIRPSMSCIGMAHDNIIDANLISANFGDGVAISSCPPNTDVFMNHVTRNILGADISGINPLGNHHAGVYLGEGTHDNLVADNVICDNVYEGVSIIGYYQAGGPAWFTRQNHVDNNLIGLGADGISILGNHRNGVAIGVWGPNWKLGYAESNDIRNNTIAHNNHDGIMIWENPVNTANADFNTISQNALYANGQFGIDLNDDGLTHNDAGDPDVSANEGLNFPVITTAEQQQGATTITGTLDVDSNPSLATVEVFLVQSNPAHPGYGQGKTYLGSTIPGPAGNWSLQLSGLVVGDSLCATATDVNFNTSEFGRNVVVQPSTFVLEHGITDLWTLSPTLPNPVRDYACWDLTLCENAYISMCIFNPEGQLVSHIYEGWLQSGDYTFVWDGLDNNGAIPQSGVYLMQLQTTRGVAVRRMLKL